MEEDILLQVLKPGRYIGNEWNVCKKDFAAASIKFALSFPDLYEIGMSNLGLRIIYGILNNIPDVVCERFFSVNDDLEKILRDNSKQISSLESGKGLSEFDLIGFSLGSELDYTNVLNILDLGALPIKASERSNLHPLVIGGGPCALNPEPMHDFFDLFIIGEAEEVILELIEIYRRNQADFKTGKISREDLLLKFSQVEGIYVPSFYEAVYDPSGQIQEFRAKASGVPLKINKRFVKNFDSAYFPVDWLVPYIQVIHDRVSLEIMRGCPNRCRFCQARSQYFPLRYRSVENVLKLAYETYKRTGYEEISLAGLSVSDYPRIEELAGELIKNFKADAVSISLPSVRAKPVMGELSAIIAKIKKTGLTFAPEAGTKRLRDILAKDFKEDEFFISLEEAYKAGYLHVKLYFMIGLPFETDADLDGIIDFANRVSESKRKFKKGTAQVNISINTLIPKPHTCLQYFAMDSIEEVARKQDYLKGKVKNKKLNLSFHNRGMSFLEGILSRGDRRLSEVILLAFKKGARFDAWGDHLALEKWLEAFKEANIDPGFYLKERQTGQILPWDFIDTGISKDSLSQEMNKLIEIK